MVLANPKSPTLYFSLCLKMFSHLRSLCSTLCLCISYVKEHWYCEGSDQLFENSHCFLFRDLSSLAHFSVKVTSIAVLQRQNDILLVFVSVVAAHDVVTVALKHDLHLALQEFFTNSTDPLGLLFLDLLLADELQGHYERWVLG